jgi:hypothetical protein
MIPVIEESLRHRVLQSLVNIAHFGKIAVCGCSKQTTTSGELPKVINTDHHQKPACAGCIRLSLRPRPHAVVEHSKSRRPQLPRVGAVSFESVAQFEISAFCFLLGPRTIGFLAAIASIKVDQSPEPAAQPH